MQLIFERSRVPDCGECDAWDENPEEYVREAICPECAWGFEVNDIRIYKLLDYLSLLDAGCPVGRHELRNEEWIMIGMIKVEKEKMAFERMKNKNKGEAE